MINDLLHTMSIDMNIPRYNSETDESFIYRLCYSALGQWCLALGRNSVRNKDGSSKNNQTILLNELLKRFIEIFPNISDRFVDPSNRQSSISVSIRRIYEETGYLITDEDNHNVLANYGRSILIGNQALFFGLPKVIYAINGLGVFSEPTEYEVTTKDFLIRDDLTYEEFFKSCFDPIDFYDRDINAQELEFFNPLAKNVPSNSWEKTLETDCSIARKTDTGPYYRVMRMSEGILYADEPVESQSDAFISYEYRRLYFALKLHYKNPVKITISRLDDEYSRMRIGGHLPNREYYFLLLLSWPERTAYDKVNYIIKNNLLEETLAVLENIGIDVKGGRFHG